MQVTYQNTGTAPRGVYDVFGKVVVIPPGEAMAVNVPRARPRNGLVVVNEGKAPRPAPAKREAGQDDSAELVALKAKAERLDIEVDGRWSIETLRTKIAEAEAVVKAQGVATAEAQGMAGA